MQNITSILANVSFHIDSNLWFGYARLACTIWTHQYSRTEQKRFNKKLIKIHPNKQANFYNT